MTKDAEFIAFEKGLREQIAKEIEAYVLSDDTSEHYKLALPVLRATFATIVRGKVGK
jgi:hypothetical protein